MLTFRNLLIHKIFNGNCEISTFMTYSPKYSVRRCSSKTPRSNGWTLTPFRAFMIICHVMANFYIEINYRQIPKNFHSWIRLRVFPTFWCPQVQLFERSLLKKWNLEFTPKPLICFLKYIFCTISLDFLPFSFHSIFFRVNMACV